MEVKLCNFCKTLISDVPVLCMHMRLRALCFFQAFRWQGYLAWTSLFIYLLLFSGCWFFVFPSVTQFLEKHFLTIVEMFGLPVGLKCVVLLHVLFMCAIVIPLVGQMYNTLCFSPNIRFLYHYLRRPSAIPLILTIEAVISVLFVEVVLWPCLWSPFIPKLSAEGIFSMLLLKTVLLGTILILGELCVAARIWCHTLRYALQVAWIAAIGYYGGIIWLSYKSYLDLKYPSKENMTMKILQLIYQAVDGNHNIQTLCVGMVIWVLVFWLARLALAQSIHRWGNL